MMATDTTTATVLMMNTSMRSPRPWPILSSQLTDRVPHDGASFLETGKYMLLFADAEQRSSRASFCNIPCG